MALMRESRQKIFNRRSIFMLGGQLTIFGILGGRLTYLQLLESDRYKTLADENRIRSRLVAPERGHIFDRNQLELARNTDNYRILLIPEEADNVKNTLRQLSKIVVLPASTQKKILEDVSRSPVFQPIELIEHLNWVEVSKIEIERLNLPGVYIDAGQERIYPQGNLYAHIIGFVAQPNQKEVKQSRLFSIPGFHIGKNGLEKFYEPNLRGEGGALHLEVNASGRPLKEVKKVPATRGKNIRLSIDNRLQDYVTQRMSSVKAGAVVLMDVHSGEVLSMVSTPDFDPNKFVRGIEQLEWDNLLNNPYKPLSNKAVSGLYAPASTFKPVVTLAALENGLSPHTRHFCSGSIPYGRRKFYCWARWGHKNVNITKAMSNSCDVWFYKVALETGVDEIAKYARMFGLGTDLNIQLHNNKIGTVPDIEWKQKVIGSNWESGETLITGIGQGYLTATPLQLATMTARFVNGGYAVKPTLLMLDDDKKDLLFNQNQPIFGKLPVKDSHLALINRGMYQVVNHRTGTAYNSRVTNPNFAFSGKTGTAQVRNISEKERETGVIASHLLDWKKRDHALFVGYAPVRKPRWAISVVVEHGNSGSIAAAPIARDVLVNVQRLYKDGVV